LLPRPRFIQGRADSSGSSERPHPREPAAPGPIAVRPAPDRPRREPSERWSSLPGSSAQKSSPDGAASCG
jgi:hypothetical protein